MRRRDDKNFFEGNIELHPLAAGLNRIYKTVQKDGLSEDTMLTLQDDISCVSKHFGISPKSAVLLGCIAENNSNNGIDTDDLAGYVGCSNIEFIGFNGDFSDLEKKGIIMRAGTRGRRTIYLLTREAAKSVEDGSDFVPMNWSGISIDEFFTRLRILFSDFRKDVIDSERLLQNIRSVVTDNQQLSLCSRLTESGFMDSCPDTEQRFFFYMCHRLVSFGNSSVPVDRLLGLTEFMEDDQRIRRCISNQNTFLQKNGIATFGGNDGFQDMDSLALSDDAVKEYLGEVTLMRKNDESDRNLVKAASITAKDLFYNPTEGEQMERLAGLLDDTNFKGVQSRLGEMGMRKGFAVLFSGGAGCGKTAGVYELARRTGRDIYAVDMSQLKSKWVGDSEKIVKGVFNTYAEMCRTREKAPILLFNEADAIFAKRIENPEHSVEQMMNAIQNICLDAIENLDGILVATTNLAENFCDEAFARRFIFKVNFTTPEADVRAKIWRSMIPSLSEEDAATMGSRFTFSGGNIENVARKAAVGYVLSGQKATLEDLVKYAGEETLASQRKAAKIGF